MPPVSQEESDRTSLKRINCYKDGGDQSTSPPSKQARRDEQQRGMEDSFRNAEAWEHINFAIQITAAQCFNAKFLILSSPVRKARD